MSTPPARAVVALAGRRIDLDGATPERFPLRNRARVEQDIRVVLADAAASTLVCSAACGADLLALAAAASLGIGRRIVLPFEVARFRQQSVIDRPGDWGALFDEVVGEVARSGNLVVLPTRTDDHAAYAEATRAILAEADALATAADGPKLAIGVWDGEARGPEDFTQQFLTHAIQRGFATTEVRTI